MPPNNVMLQAQRKAWFIDTLIKILTRDESDHPDNPLNLSTLSDEQGESLQAMIDNPPADLAGCPPDHIVVPIEEVMALAQPGDWLLARSMIQEQARAVDSGFSLTRKQWREADELAQAAVRIAQEGGDTKAYLQLWTEQRTD